MSGTWLKIIAITAMVIDHIGAIFFPEYNILRMIGRLTFPIFAFFVAEGAYHTKDFNRYMMRLGGFGLLSEIPFDLAFNKELIFWEHQNVMWTFFLALAAIWVDRNMTKRTQSRIWFVVAVGAAAMLAEAAKTDYGMVGVLLVAVFYAYRSKPVLKYSMAALLMVYFGIRITMLRFWILQEYVAQFSEPIDIGTQFSYFFVLSDYIQVLACAAFPLLAFYNGQRGSGRKYFFYLFYPLHLLVLAGIAAFF